MKDDFLDFITRYTSNADNSENEKPLLDSVYQMKIDVRHVLKKRDGHKCVKIIADVACY